MNLILAITFIANSAFAAEVGQSVILSHGPNSAVKNIAYSQISYPSSAPYLYNKRDLDISPSGIPGQNTDPPLAKVFAQHFIVRNAQLQEYYDPSYGVTTTGAAPYSGNINSWGRTDLQWRDASGSGLLVQFTDDDGY